MAEARVFKFCALIGHIKLLALRWHTTPKWVRLGSRDQFQNFWGPYHIFGRSESRHFEFGLHIDVEEYLSRLDRLPPNRGMFMVT